MFKYYLSKLRDIIELFHLFLEMLMILLCVYHQAPESV